MSDRPAPWLAEVPVTLHRRVKWGECDPAGVVYTPRFGDYVAEAFLGFMEALLQGPASARMAELDVGTPVKAMRYVFHRSLYPEQDFAVRVWCGDLRTRSFDLTMQACDGEGRLVFEAQLSAICVHGQVRQSRAIPPELRERLERYRAKFTPPPPEETP